MNRKDFFRTAGFARFAASLVVADSKISSSVARPIGQGKKNIPNPQVTDQTGRTYRFYDDLIKDKMVVINFFYASCTGICPRMTSNLVKVQQELRKRVGARLGQDILMY